MRLPGKVAVITGGNSGIDLATAREFVANGAKAAIFDQAARSLCENGFAIQGDVRQLGGIERLFAHVGEQLVNSI